MINKPINAYPYNVCVNANESFDIEYELPNNTSIDGAYVSIKDLQGKELWSDYQVVGGASSVKSGIYKNIDTGGEKELFWNSFYWTNIENDSYSVQIADIPKRITSDGSIQVGLIPSGRTTDSFKTHLQYEYYDKIHNKTSGGNICVSAVNAICPDCSLMIDPDDSKYWVTGTHFYWDDVDLGHSSFSSVDEAKECWNDSWNYEKCYIYHPSASLVSWLATNKANINSEKFLLTSKSGDGHISFLGHIEGFLYNNNCTVVYSTYSTKSRYNASYIVFFLQKGVACNNLTTEDLCMVSTYNNVFEDERYYYPDVVETIALADSIEIYSNFSSSVSNGDYLMLDSKPKIVLNSEIEDGRCYITTEPAITEDEINAVSPLQNIGFFKTSPDNANTTQNFYFRYKSPPALSVINTSEPVALAEGDDEEVIVEPTKQVNDVKCEFGISYESQYKLNYFYLYLMGYDTITNEWNLLSSSEMLNKATDTHTFDGLMDGHEYAVYCVCYDIDGDEWQSDEYHFVVSNPGETSNKIDISFNSESTAVELSIQKLLPAYKNLHIDFYKEEVNAAIKPQLLKYAGGGYSKTGGENDVVNGITIFDTLRDYNVRNNTEYQYYAKISYVGRNYDDDGNEPVDDTNSGTIWFKIPKTICTDFAGTSVMGLSERHDNVYEITNEFKILYQREEHEDAINYELSRDYADTVGKYSYEIRGSQNYKTGECAGLLGSCVRGEYVEPALLSDKWQRFVNGDEIKLYRGLNGETLIISIESTKIAKPTYVNARRVSDVTFTFREIADANNYVVYETELVEV